jgi:hypothetical protein
MSLLRFFAEIKPSARHIKCLAFGQRPCGPFCYVALWSVLLCRPLGRFGGKIVIKDQDDKI